MAFFDNFSKKVQDVAFVATEKAQQVAAVAGEKANAVADKAHEPIIEVTIEKDAEEKAPAAEEPKEPSEAEETKED